VSGRYMYERKECQVGTCRVELEYLMYSVGGEDYILLPTVTTTGVGMYPDQSLEYFWTNKCSLFRLKIDFRPMNHLGGKKRIPS